MIQTAFQIGAFQFTAFQEGRAVGSGAKRFILGQALARRHKPLRESPTPEEVAEILVTARARLNLRPVPYVTTDLSAFAADMKRKDRERELAQFRELVELILDDLDEAA